MERQVTTPPVHELAFSARVDGGELSGIEFAVDGAVDRQGDTALPVLGLHGITAHHGSFRSLAERTPGRLIAPDLRGRGSSRELPGPYSLTRLADDAARVLDARAVDQAVVVGHSMGAFVAVLLAARYPDRVTALVLVDGGLPLPKVDDPAAALGPALQRLTKTFQSREAYRDYWRQHPAFGPYWTAAQQAYVDEDLVETSTGLRPAASPAAVEQAMTELAGLSDRYIETLSGLTVPATLLRSPRGLLDESPGLYSDGHLASWQLPTIEVRDVPATNHYTILLSDGADAVAAAVRQAMQIDLVGRE